MNSIWDKIEPLLPSVERPSRYIGSEWTSSSTTIVDGDLKFCMVYPDTYELGQPNQAIRILVNAVNSTCGLYADRAFLPAVDMIKLMRENNIPAFSLESCAPIADFDAVGITLPHELCATNVLEFLDLAGIAIRATDRDEADPIILGGGPCVCNPEPYAAAFDAISVGEGEEAMPEILLAIKEGKANGLSRAETISSLANINGVYVPSLYEPVSSDVAYATGYWVRRKSDDASPVVVKRIFAGFSYSSAYEPIVVPFMEIVHDRLNVEILRGCARGCRFCQAGMMYRPVRERSADNIVDSVCAGLEETGYEEVSLTSLSSTDHSQIEEILTRLNDKFADKGVRISVPSQRLDSFGVDMACLVAGRKRGGLTFAPEAGTQRLRNVINKNISDDDLMNATRAAVDAGWRREKLYFMIGLPTERDDDLLGIADMCNRAYEIMKECTPPAERGNLSLSVSINVFVPKAQTPFQWDGQISADEALRRVAIIKSALKYNAINVSYHEPKTSLLEAAMSRGGREMFDVVEGAWKRGARFDAWTEHFDADAWRNAASECGVDMAAISEVQYVPGSVVPWSHISFCADNQFLIDERIKAESELTTPDCTLSNCSACGVCTSLKTSNKIAGERKQ